MHYLVYITCKDQKEAATIASFVIENGFAACANIFPPHQSLYMWEGTLHNEQEVAMILKTTQERYPALEKAIKNMHSYDVPCIVALPVEQGNPDFLRFIEQGSCA